MPLQDKTRLTAPQPTDRNFLEELRAVERQGKAAETFQLSCLLEPPHAMRADLHLLISIVQGSEWIDMTVAPRSNRPLHYQAPLLKTYRLSHPIQKKTAFLHSNQLLSHHLTPTVKPFLLHHLLPNSKMPYLHFNAAAISRDAHQDASQRTK